ncbi:response regulator transcription factor [Mahella australiensis]|uniref:Stage 0 sporulation protein A homolog n=1 Tax=Mahella australiensis (strain DSM 15567 / CIP 107919 / 50-1 BON) TaxID=697281 RepID=F4A0S7_MAHA5|nr:response regulator [Mahella australiensis]AEE96973.1 two component transcriptional regulator, AraC family [Mahella australiensis 50-1 BON]
MIKLLIVDDEPIIVDGLVDLFQDMDEPRFNIYKAYSAKEALDIMKTASIDIVLTDICMPGMTGLELQKRIKSLWPFCKTIFLTGFDEFEYAQSAIKNGISDFVLKMEGDDAILAAVMKAVNELDREMRDKRLIEQAEASMMRALPILQSKYLIEMVNGAEYTSEERQRLFAECNMPFDYNEPVLMAIGKIDHWGEAGSIAQKTKIMYGVKNTVEQCFADSMSVLTVDYSRSKFLIFIQSKDKNCIDQNYIKNFVSSILERVQLTSRNVFCTPVSFIVSSDMVTWDMIAAQFDLLKATLYRTGVFDSELFVMAENPQQLYKGDRGAVAIRQQLKQIPLLATFLESGHQERFMGLYSSIMDAVSRVQPVSYELMQEVYYSIALTFLSYFNKNSTLNDVCINIDLTDIMNMDKHGSWDDISTYFKDIAQYIFEQRKYEYTANNIRVVDYINAYIQQNLDSDLSLTKLADLVHFNASYLSRLYKQVTGENISEYISDLRLSKAKELLSDINVRINEIAKSVGFDTPSYFARFFKKNTNMTPQEYRDKIFAINPLTNSMV